MSSVGRSSVVMASGTLVSRVLGLLRTTLTIGVTGLTGLAADAWQISNTLPNIFQLLLAGGVINAVIIPQITRAMKHEDGGRDYLNRLITLAITIMLATAVVLTVAAPLIVSFFVSGSWSSEARRLAVIFAFLCLPQMFFYGLYTLLGQVLNAREKFGAYMWAPALANLIAIGGLAWFYLTDQPIQAPVELWTWPMILVLAGTATLSIAAQALVLLIPLHQIGFRYRPTWGFRGHGLRSASTMALWAFAAVVVSQVAGFVVTTRVLTAATNELTKAGVEGAGLTAYSNAFLIFMLPHGIITVSVVTALFTRISRAAGDDRDWEAMADLHQGMALGAVILLPITAAVILAAPIIAQTILFTTTPSVAHLIVPTLIAMIVGLLPYAWFYLVQRVYFAYTDGRTPFMLQVILTIVASSVTLALATRTPENASMWVGIGQTLSNTAAAALGLVWLHRRFGSRGVPGLIQMHLRALVATLLVSVLAGLALRALVSFAPTSWWLQAIGGGLICLGLLLGSWVLMSRMKIAQARDLVAPLRSRLGR